MSVVYEILSESRSREDASLFYEASITLIPEPEKDIQENYSPVSLMSMIQKSSKKLTNWFQQCIGRFIHNEQDLFYVYMGSLTLKNQLM